MAGLYILVDKMPVKVSDTSLFDRPAKIGMIPVKQQWIGKVFVSTVFLATDEDHIAGQPLKLFETLIDGGEYDGVCNQYCSWKEAKKGHKKIVQGIKALRDGNKGNERELR